MMPTHRPPTHPGEMLLEEFMKPMGLSQVTLALDLGVPLQRLNTLIRGKRGVTPDTAIRLAKRLGMGPEFWLGLQMKFDLWHAMRAYEAKEPAPKTASSEPTRHPPKPAQPLNASPEQGLRSAKKPTRHAVPRS